MPGGLLAGSESAAGGIEVRRHEALHELGEAGKAGDVGPAIQDAAIDSNSCHQVSFPRWIWSVSFPFGAVMFQEAKEETHADQHGTSESHAIP